MLVLGRKEGEKIFLIDKTTKVKLAEVTVVDIDRNKVRLGLDALPNVAIYREEIAPGYEQAPPGT